MNYHDMHVMYICTVITVLLHLPYRLLLGVQACGTVLLARLVFALGGDATAILLHMVKVLLRG